MKFGGEDGVPNKTSFAIDCRFIYVIRNFKSILLQNQKNKYIFIELFVIQVSGCTFVSSLFAGRLPRQSCSPKYFPLVVLPCSGYI